MDNSTRNNSLLARSTCCSQERTREPKTTTFSFHQHFNTPLKRLVKGLRFSLFFLFTSFIFLDTSAQYITVDGDPSEWPAVFTNGAITVKQFIDDPINDQNDNIWTQGSSATNDIDTWAWTTKGANDKGDIDHAGIALVGDTVFFFVDRYSNNGDEAVGIWIFVDPVSLNPDGSFSGLHTNGDILITSHFVNGGTAVDRNAYIWMNGVLVERIVGDVDLSTRTNADDVPAPLSWNYVPKQGNADEYPSRSFFEGYINLGSDDFPDIDVCFSTFLIETRNSQSLDASLEDLTIGAFLTRPLVSLEDEVVCDGSAAMFTAVANGNPPFTYFWSEGSRGGPYTSTGNTNTYSIDPATASDSVYLYVMGGTGCISDTVGAFLTVTENPDCSITGDDDVCPGSSNVYSAPAGMDSYSWSIISGSASIDGSTTGQTVTVIAPATCGSYTIGLVVTVGECSSNCSETFNATDTEAPVVTATGTTLTLGCNPSEADINAALGTATATDNCGPVTATPTDGQVMIDGCTYSQTRSWSATDGCGNTGTASRTVSWTVDTEAPVVTATGTTLTLGCNPSEADINAALGTATATDNCGPVTATPTDGQVMIDGCTYSQTRSWSATDGCGNTGTASRTVSWTVDAEAPVVTATGTTLTLGCNPSEADINAALGTATATDNCGPVTATPTDGQVMIDGCTYSQTRSWSATDGCGNTGTASRTVSWTVDTEAPVVTATGTTLTLGCNPSEADINAALGTATATDNCGPVTATPTDGQVMIDGCTYSQTRSWSATDGCGNTGTASRTVSWTVDTEAPVVTATGTTLTLGCNPSEADINAALGTATATDNCGPVTATPTDGQVMIDGCTYSQTRSWSATDGCGNTGTASRTVSWTVDTEAPVVTATGTTLTLGCNPSEADINAALGTATATDNCGPVTATPTDGQVMIDGCTYSQTRSWSATDGCGNTGTASRTVSWTVDTEDPGFSSMPADMDLDCGADIPAMPEITGTDNCDLDVNVGVQVTDDPANCSTGFSRIITRTWTATDDCGNTSMHTQTIRVRCCPDILCTYTQGYFGNDGGMACNGDDTEPNMFTTFETIQNSINAQGGSITIGNATNNVVVTNSAADINKVIEVLPGGGKSAAFTHAGSIGIQDLPDSYLKNGNLNNTLFAQTLTLSINRGISDGLGDFALEAGMYLVTAEPVECGSSVVKECEYEWNGTEWVLTYSPYKAYGPIPAALYDALPTKDVSGLLELANNALGGDPLPAGVSLGMIADAVDMINNAFDECRVFMSWSESDDLSGMCEAPAATEPVTVSSKVNVDVDAITSGEKLQVTAFPNPVPRNNRFSLRIRSTETGPATIEYFNMNGSKLSQSNRMLRANVTEIVTFNGGTNMDGAIIYKVSINGKFSRGIVMRLN